MENTNILKDSLVLYKNRPARVLEIADRITIVSEDQSTNKVRQKDIILLHPGPIDDLKKLTPLHGDVESAWQIIEEGDATCTLGEIAELIYGEYTPRTAWAAWQLVEEGLYFCGTTGSISACSVEQITTERRSRQLKAEETQAWEAFLDRARTGQIDQQADQRYLREVEDLALGLRTESRVLPALGKSLRPETAHALLLEWCFWDEFKNPYPARSGVLTESPTNQIPPMTDEHRLDLTNLPAYAIDDSGNQDPDDAISLVDVELDEQGHMARGRIWVHVADPSCVVMPDSALDIEARQRGSTLYLPEGAVPMLPWGMVHQFGLGLNEVSPALSIELELNGEVEPQLIQIAPSLVSVERITYEEAENRLSDEPFSKLLRLAQGYEARRKTNGALSPDLPEAIISVKGGEVIIRPIETLQSRDLVREAMLMAGEAISKYAVDNAIPFPFTLQDQPDSPERIHQKLYKPDNENTLSANFTVRRLMKRSQLSTYPAQHAGLGLPQYTRFTSPLRRYLDLVAHQQIRRHLLGQPVLNDQDLLQRLGESEEASGRVARVESLSRRHWSLVYFLQHPQWQGEAILVDRNGMRGQVIVPELAFEATINLRSYLPLDTRIMLHLQGVNLSELDVSFS